MSDTEGPVVQDIFIWQGDRYEMLLRLYELVWNPATGMYTKGGYLDLTGQTPMAWVVANRGDLAPFQQWQCSLGDQNLFRGSILCVLKPSQTAQMIASSYQYDIQLAVNADNITTYVTGTIAMGKQATQNA